MTSPEGSTYSAESSSRGRERRRAHEAAQENPWWSDRARTEAQLQAMRPRSLPPLQDMAPRGRPEALAPMPAMVASSEGVVYPLSESRELAALPEGVPVVPPLPGLGMMGEEPGVSRVERLLLAMVAQSQTLHQEVRELKARVDQSEVRPTRSSSVSASPAPKAPPVQAVPVPKVGQSLERGRAAMDPGPMPSGGDSMARLMLGSMPTSASTAPTTSATRPMASSLGGAGGGEPPRQRPPAGGCGEKETWSDAFGGAWTAPAAWEHRWLGGESRDEGVRSIELPPLPGLHEGELGPLAAGDWLALITPMMKDLSSSSALWWDGVMEEATRVYEQWLQSEPLARLHLRPGLPPGCERQPWARLEQRAQTMLLKALPEDMKAEAISSRSTASVELLFRILKKYQPGGLSERTHVLKQLVEGRSPGSVGDMVGQLQLWMRWFKRAKELRIDVPDATLLMGALDRLAQPLVKLSPQSAFRLSTVRAALQVDVMPTQEGARAFAETLLAEGEVAYHAGDLKATGAKIKATYLSEKADRGDRSERSEKPEVADGRQDGPMRKGEAKRTQLPCKFFATEEGCRRGASCPFAHEGDKSGRCWACGSTKHVKRDCPVRQKAPDGGDRGRDSKPDIKNLKKASEEVHKASPLEAEEDRGAGGAIGSSGKASEVGDDFGGLLREAAGLLKSLRAPSVKAVQLQESGINLSQLGGRDKRALLDGGATHCLRTAVSEEEWQAAEEVEVALAIGSATLRQIPSSKTILTRDLVQPIVPLGVLAEIGFSVVWEGQSFQIKDRGGHALSTRLDAGCPTVEEKVGLDLIRVIEKQIRSQHTRLALLRGEEVNPRDREELGKSVVGWINALKETFPEVPVHLLERVVPSGEYQAESLPWNRHVRRRLRRASEVVVHLFSGGDEKTWKELSSEGREILCVDLALHRGHDLLEDQVASYLMELCSTGRVRLILAGPPCRSVSKLRQSQPGPPPLRMREGVERFGISGQGAGLQETTDGDTTLFLRTLFFYMVAQRASDQVDGGKVGFIMENPEDPERYDPQEPEEKKCPSFWAWPEWKVFEERFQMARTSFDQGPMGHVRRKPTTLASNLGIIKQLEGERGPGQMRGLGKTVEERVQQSKTWAAWAPGLKRALIAASKWFLEQREVRKLTTEQWKAHLRNDHMPFRPECRTCVEAAGRGRMHKRVNHPQAYTLSVDLGGPYESGKDQTQVLGKYLVVGVYTFPTTKEGELLMKPEPGELGRETLEIEPEKESPEKSEEKEEGIDVLEAKPRHEEFKDGDDREAWEKLVQKEDDVKIRQLTFTEVVPSRHSRHVVPTIGKIYTRLRCMGLPVLRVHSDRAKELTSETMFRWARDRNILRTFTDGDSWKMNGRAEAEIGVVSRATKTLLTQCGMEPKLWPLAARHAAERRLRGQLEALNLPVLSLLPFGSYGYAKMKEWTDRGNWKRARTRVQIMGPDMTINSGGYFVRDAEGRFFHTTDVRTVEDAREEPEAAEAEDLGWIQPDGKKPEEVPFEPRRRVDGKRPVAALQRLEKISEELRSLEEQRWHGLRMIEEEAEIRERFRPQEGGSFDILDPIIEQTQRLERRIRVLAAEAEKVSQEECTGATEWLQTVTVPLGEVRKEMEAWRPAALKEYEALMANGAVRKARDGEVEELSRRCKEEGKIFELVPGKAVCTRKAPDGKRKVRGVVCGNYMEERPSSELYASGVDVAAVRSLIRHAALQGHRLATVDVKTAFLQVPAGRKEDVTVITPPKLFQDLHIAEPGEKWVLEGTLYGTVTAPREWGDYRDEVMQKMRWGEREQWRVRRTPEANLWSLEEWSEGERSWQNRGFIAVYVDDVMTSGSEATVQGFLDEFRRRFECSDPEWIVEGKSVGFCGLEVTVQDGGYRVHQESYAKAVLGRRGVVQTTSVLKVIMPDEDEAEPTVSAIREAQAVTGEVLWLSGHTRPDLAYASSIMSQFAVRRPTAVKLIGDEVLKYLASDPSVGLHYGAEADVEEQGEYAQLPVARRRGTVEVHCDAAFAASAQKSMTSVVVKYGGAPIFWLSIRQSLMALSTAEAELGAQLEALTAGRGARCLVGILEGESCSGVIYNDNMAAISISSQTSGSWRTRHLRIRAYGLSEAIESGEWVLRHLDGRYLTADGLTKQLAGQPHERFLVGLHLRPEAEKVPMRVSTLSMAPEHVERVRKALALVVTLGSCVKGAAAQGPEAQEDGIGTAFLIAVIVLVYILGEGMKRFGSMAFRRLLGAEDVVRVKVVREGATVPTRGSDAAAGWDLYAVEDLRVPVGESALVNTGIAVELPSGTYARLAPRSSLMLRGLEVGPGVIDRDFRGEVKMLLTNRGSEEFRASPGDRIGQMLIEKIYDGGLKVVSELSGTRRGEGAFGSTGLRALRREELPPGARSGLRQRSERDQATGGLEGRVEGLERENGERDDGPHRRRSVRPAGEGRGEVLRGDVGMAGQADQDGGHRWLWHTERGEVFHRDPDCVWQYQRFVLKPCQACFGPAAEWPPAGSVQVVDHEAHLVGSRHGSRRGAPYRILRPCRTCAG